MASRDKYSRAEESPAATLKPPPQITVKFVDVTKEVGIDFAGSGAETQARTFWVQALAFFDYDGDGKHGLFLAEQWCQGGCRLFHNLGGDKFEDVTKKAGLDPACMASAARPATTTMMASPIWQ